MKLYFSGIAGAPEYRMAQRAGVGHVLADQFDVKNIDPARENVALDSGAYRAWKKGQTLGVDDYADFIRAGGRRFDFIVNLDVIRDPEASRANWLALYRKHGIRTMPVWHYDMERFEREGDESATKELEQYLMLSEVVGIGGLVPYMRDKDEDILANVTWMCKRYPNRFHIFGLNWLKAIKELKDYLWSADTSKWLDGARYRHEFVVDEESGELAQMWSEKDRETLCVHNARAMEAFVAGAPIPAKSAPVPAGGPARAYKLNDRTMRRAVTV